MGAALYNYYKHGELKAEGSSITEGIGQGRITKNLEGAPIDVPYQIPDEEVLPIVFDLLIDEGLCVGRSTGINVAGAIRLAREIGPGHTIVTILCDYGTRYQSKLFNPEFLRSKGLPVPDWLERRPNSPSRSSRDLRQARRPCRHRLACRPSEGAGRAHRRRFLVPAGSEARRQGRVSPPATSRARCSSTSTISPIRQSPAAHAAEPGEIRRARAQARHRRRQPHRRL